MMQNKKSKVKSVESGQFDRDRYAEQAEEEGSAGEGEML